MPAIRRPPPTCAFVAKYETDDQNALDSQQKHLDVGGNRRRRIHVGCSRRGGLCKAPKSYAHPVLEFLARSQSQNPAALSGVLRFAHLGSRRQANSRLRNTGSRTLIAMLPVLFIGLVSPLDSCLRRIHSMPGLARRPCLLLSALFQRPPPSLA